MRIGVRKLAVQPIVLRMLCAAVATAAVATFSGATALAGLLYNPIVVDFGDGTTPLTSAVGVPAAVNLYTASVPNQSSPVSSATFSNSGSGPNLVVTANGSAEAALANNPTLANDAAQGIAYSGSGYAYMAGYNTSDGSATSAAVRSAGVVTVGPTSISSPTVLATQTAASAYNGSTIRSAVGDDNGPNTAAIYTAGAYGTGQQATAGWREFISNTQVYPYPGPPLNSNGTGWANTRTTELLGSQLFGSMSSGTTVGIYTINPSTSSASSWINVGTSSNHSPYEFALFDDLQNSNTSNGYNVAYIADDGNAGAAAEGIEKWVYNGSAWTQAYILGLSGTAQAYHGLAGEFDATTGNAVLFATTSDGSKLVQIADPLDSTNPSNPATDSYVTLASAGTNFAFRGVALAPAAVPEPGTVGLLTLSACLLLWPWGWRSRRGAATNAAGERLAGVDVRTL